MWRRPGPCEHHAREPYEPYEPNESDDFNEPYQPNESDDFNEPCDPNDESCHLNESHKPGGSGQCAVTMSCTRCFTGLHARAGNDPISSR
ncbi:hypothetical protein [Mycobacterium colombiense]|uniref:Uncharacterized protein n=1 Tax=Mycobacterium colombiense TaxID=339268 RepID=A0A1A2YXK1_9MYCO|nr:hypothetical protein [Mycobacterium colombiense]OBI43014.1 hypothetical protein A5708_19470 [Mycobacterium colombiense]